ncbi:hypothetical protein O9K51_09955 [Purpureocillium lavendulum]|uniref:Uncharacterized protein n=1 Tax=Purpureocillium lavendulum TaxID=1247861 RepID=A0AB34FEC7_9HYPO|nr:hypothetical protein O9K51_09955 [Purpureocillium lavendulum]
MKIGIPILVLCGLSGSTARKATGNALVVPDDGNAGKTEHTEAMRLSIEKNLKVDPKHAPFRDTNRENNVTCWQDVLGLNCFKATYVLRNQIQADTAKVSAWFSVNVEARDTAGQASVQMGLQTSTSFMHSVTYGFSVAATMQVNNFGFVGGTIGADTSLSISKSSTQTKTYSRSYTCPPWTRCMIQTMTWHVDVTGECAKIPIIHCREDHAVCGGASLTCDNYRAFADKWCPRVAFTEPCTVSTPIMGQDGKPLSEVRLVEIPKKQFRITGWSEDCDMALLENGEQWNPAKNMYHADGKWYQSADRVTPVLTKCTPRDSSAETEDEDAEGR